ncbi:MAG: alpha/beta hydrolase [Actinomycetota bacterium]|nr:alpha/beta hydrolase [Actinomycetota bacterium]
MAVVSPSADVSAPMPGAVIDGRFPVEDGRQLALSCWGEGSPTIVLEDGHPSEQGGRFQFGRTGGAFLNALVADTRVCAYDRAGYAASDPAPNEPRTADNVIGDLRALLAAAEVAGPYVLVGSSFGGMIVTYYAARHPEDVAGVVLLDVPAPTDTLTLEEIPELAWDHAANPEHVDVIPEFESRFANERLPIQAPLTVITASEGQSSVEDQSVWLEFNPAATQVQLVGDHDIYLSDALGVAAEVVKLL